ncbi:MAG: carboxypeptidase-like regulatory domain-containing protein, partial [Polyangiales bacterium]
MMRDGALLLLLICCAAPVAAQPGPRGPAEVIGEARKARDVRELRQATRRDQPDQPDQPAAAAPANPHAEMQGSGAAPTNPHGGVMPPDAEQGTDNPHAGMAMPGEPLPISNEREDTSLPTGSLRVRVIDAKSAPVPDAEISLGIMVSDGTRSSRTVRTGPDGSVVVAGHTPRAPPAQSRNGTNQRGQ